MKRDLIEYLKTWKSEPLRKPLIIRGARQVGKTWLTDYFGKNYFTNYFTINFELSPEFKSCFNRLDPEEIVSKIELTANTELRGKDTLLFLDEIQECPSAIKSLRYFYERLPSLAVIAAGSLLEFVEKTEDISIPVGRVVNFNLQPLSFGEYLTAIGEEKLRNFLGTLGLQSDMPESVIQKCESLLRMYMYSGGMPAAIVDWIAKKEFLSTDLIHRSLLQNYRQDLGKYGKVINGDLLENTFLKVPGLVGSTFSYAAIDNTVQSRNVKQVIGALQKAKIITRVSATSGAGLSFYTYVNKRRFKVLFLDVGLFQNSMGINSSTYLAQDLLAAYRGAVSEQFVGQQLLSLKKPYEDPDLFYWYRNTPGSEAEVDYLYQYNDKIIPIEVKSGKTGTLKSMHLFLKENNAPLGVRFSLLPLSLNDNVLSIPLYAIESLPELIKQALRRVASGT